MTAEAGHHANRSYMGQDGAFHLNGASFYNDAEEDISGELEKLGPLAALSGSTTVAADVLAIPVTHRIVVKTTGADGEALTLANGEPGQRLTIVLGTDGGGDGTLTPTTCTGFATIVFADAGDHATLEYIDDTVGWVLLGTGGVAAPPAITVS